MTNAMQTETNTDSRAARTSAYWSKLAGEPVTAERFPDGYRTYASELAVLRLNLKYDGTKGKRVYYVASVKSWCFSLEVA